MSPALPRADPDALMSVVSRLREVAARLRDASSSDADVQSIATEASLLFLDLKAANREVLESAEETREATAAAKAALATARVSGCRTSSTRRRTSQKEIRANQDFRSRLHRRGDRPVFRRRVPAQSPGGNTQRPRRTRAHAQETQPRTHRAKGAVRARASRSRCANPSRSKRA